jgi:hypothetical protein
MVVSKFNKTELLVAEVRRYTEVHPELTQAHHFCFDLPFNSDVHEPDIIVMGINPGHSKGDFNPKGNSLEESRYINFHIDNSRSAASTSWLKKTEKIVGTNKVIFAEMFFWSANNLKEL